MTDIHTGRHAQRVQHDVQRSAVGQVGHILLRQDAGCLLYTSGRVKTYEAIVKGEPIPQPGIPESFRVMLKELQSLDVYKRQDQPCP